MEGFTTRSIGERGQVTLPKKVREKLMIEKGDKIAFIELEQGYLIKKVDEKKLRDFLLIDHKSGYNVEGE